MRSSLYRAAACAALLCSSALWSQTSETIAYRAFLSTKNAVPAVNLDASGVGTVWAHLIRDASGEIIGGSVDFDTSYKFPGEVSITAMHIHAGDATVAGPVVIDSGIQRIDGVTVGTIPMLQGQANSGAALDALKGLVADPSQYYLNVHTAVNPGGVFRGQLQKADVLVRAAILSPDNENPPTGIAASARGSVMVIRTTDNDGTTNSAQLIFDVNYTGFAADTVITAMHVHLGAAGVNGPVTLASGLTAAVPVPESGAGNLRYVVEQDLSVAGARTSIDALYYSPFATYLNVHTRVNPGGAMRGQMLNTEKVTFPAILSPKNENPPTAATGDVVGSVTLWVARDQDGNAIAGTSVFDVNPRFGDNPDTVFTAMHIHDGDGSVNGPVTIDSRFAGGTLLIKNGLGNIWRLNSIAASALPSLNSVLTNPEKHYVNIHSTVNPGGVARVQAGALKTAAPEVSVIITAASDSTIGVAPGGAASAFGVNFAKVPGNVKGVNSDKMPRKLNGVSATVAGLPAPLLVVTGDEIEMQIPFETPTGPQPVVVTTPNGDSAAFLQLISPVAPAILFDTVGAIALRVSDLSLVRPEAPAAAGDVIAIVCTGMGITRPAAPTGQIIPQDAAFVTAQTPTVTIGGINAPVVTSIAAPGFVGWYAVVVAVPPGLSSGNKAVVIRSGNVNSNSVPLAIK